MKKHLVIVAIITLVLMLAGVGLWIFKRNNNATPLYQASCEFAINQDAVKLLTNMETAQDLHILAQPHSGDTRLTTLSSIIGKLDLLNSDLNSYLTLSNAKPNKTKNLSKQYLNLTKTRSTLLKVYDEYIVRMNGDHNVDGPIVQSLHNDLVNKTINYINNYNTCFISATQYVFSKVYTIDTIKTEVYTLYSAGVSKLLNSNSNNQFTATTLIDKLNNGIQLVNGNIKIKTSVLGGEYSDIAFRFKTFFNRSNLNDLINNFVTYCSTSINENTETSNEKLAVYYAKKLLEI